MGGYVVCGMGGRLSVRRLPSSEGGQDHRQIAFIRGLLRIRAQGELGKCAYRHTGE